MSSSNLGSDLHSAQGGTALLREIGERIALIRGDRSQSAFGSEVGLHKNTVGNYERGDREIGATALLRLAELGWSPLWLLTGEGPERLGMGVREPQARYGPLSQPVSPEHLSIALELADEALEGLWLPRKKYAELVALIYEALTQGLPYAEILDFARPAAKTRAKQGAGDDGDEGVVQPGAAGTGQRAAGG